MPNETDLSAIFAHVDAHRDEYLEGLKRLVRQPSISAQGIGVRECAELLREIVAAAGLEARVVPTPGSPVVLGSSAVEPGRPTVLIYGHYDVQPPEPLEAWHSPPFEPTLRDGRLYGRGVGDNKGQLFAQLMGIKSTLAVTGSLPVNVKCIFDGEEETSSLNLPGFIERHREELRADLAYTSDGPIHDSGRPSVLLGVRGILTFELVARGANRDVHSGNFGGVVPNPAWKLIDLLATMRAPDGRVLIEGFYEHIRPLTPAERTALGRIPVAAEKVKRELALTEQAPPAELPYYERLVARPTFNICGFRSGYGGKGTKTIIPSEAVAKIDVRLVADQTGDDIFEKVRRHVARHAPDVEVIYEGYMAPSKTPIEHPYVDAIAGAVRTAWGEEPVIVPSLGGSLPDYVFTQTLGIPSIIVPYANPDESNHAPNENLELRCFYNGIKTCAAVLQAIARSGKHPPAR